MNTVYLITSLLFTIGWTESRSIRSSLPDNLDDQPGNEPLGLSELFADIIDFTPAGPDDEKTFTPTSKPTIDYSNKEPVVEEEIKKVNAYIVCGENSGLNCDENVNEPKLGATEYPAGENIDSSLDVPKETSLESQIIEGQSQAPEEPTEKIISTNANFEDILQTTKDNKGSEQVIPYDNIAEDKSYTFDDGKKSDSVSNIISTPSELYLTAVPEKSVNIGGTSVKYEGLEGNEYSSEFAGEGSQIKSVAIGKNNKGKKSNSFDEGNKSETGSETNVISTSSKEYITVIPEKSINNKGTSGKDEGLEDNENSSQYTAAESQISPVAVKKNNIEQEKSNSVGKGEQSGAGSKSNGNSNDDESKENESSASKKNSSSGEKSGSKKSSSKGKDSEENDDTESDEEHKNKSKSSEEGNSSEDDGDDEDEDD